jgi:hypothetical protein
VILPQRTYLPSHVVRRAAYYRLVPGGPESGYLPWLQRQRNVFARLRPGLKGDEFHRLFDRWLERLTLEDVK